MRKVKIKKKNSSYQKGGTPNGYRGVGQGNLIYPIYNPNDWAEPKEATQQTLQPVPENESNLEAEKGETAYLPDVGGLAAHYKIGGKRHSEGGTPLNLPDDSFIFSDTSNMKIKDPNLLKFFGKSGGSYTPADLAKQYNINEQRKILADPNNQSDQVRIKDAENMIAAYNIKLGKLALIQEAKKGFPQGIPSIALPYLAVSGIQPEQILPLKTPNQQPVEEQQESQTGQDIDQDQEQGEAQYGMQVSRVKISKKRYDDGGPFNAGPQDWANKGNALMQSGGQPTVSSLDEFIKNNQHTLPEISPEKLKELLKYKSQVTPINPGTTNVVNPYQTNLSWQLPNYLQETTNSVQPSGQVPTVQDTIQSTLSDDEVYRKLGMTPPKKAYGGNLNSYQSGGTIPYKLKSGQVLMLTQDQINKVEGKTITKPSIKPTTTSTVLTKSTTKPYKTSEDPTYLKQLFTKYNVVADPSVFQGEIGSQHVASKEPGYGDQVSLEQWKKNNPWYFEKRKAEGLKEFDPTNKADIRDFEKSHREFNKQALVNKFPNISDKELNTILDKTSFINDPNSIRYADQKMGDYHKSRMALQFNEPTPAEAVATQEQQGKASNIVPNDLQLKQQPVNAPWWLQDKIKTAGAAGDFLRVKKYLPWAAPVSPYIPDPTFYDPTRELAANAEQMQIGTQGATAFGNPQQYAATFSGIQGQGAKNVADILGKYNNLNVGAANQFSAMKGDIMNRANETNANIARDLYDKTTIANQQFDNAKNMARQELRSSYIDAVTNRANAQNINTTHPNFQIDPSSGGLNTFYRPSNLNGANQSGNPALKAFLEDVNTYPGIDPKIIAEFHGVSGMSKDNNEIFPPNYGGYSNRQATPPDTYMNNE